MLEFFHLNDLLEAVLPFPSGQVLSQPVLPSSLYILFAALI